MEEYKNQLIGYVSNILSPGKNNSSKKTLKSIGNNPISLNLNLYTTQILPNIDTYWITDKADGKRCLIIIRRKEFIYLTGDNVIKLDLSNDTNINELIFDTELIHLNGNNIFYIFDIIKFNDEITANKSFNDRLGVINKLKINVSFKKIIEIVSKVSQGGKIEFKKYLKLSLETYGNHIMKLNKELKLKPYETDGMIFTSSNKSYKETKNYKWKPVEHLTIDFLCIKLSNKTSTKTNSYYLLSGINKNLYNNLHMNMSQEIKTILKDLNYIQLDSSNNIISKFFPTPFRPSFHPNVYIYEGSEFKKDLNNKICEFSYNVKSKKWIFNRIRDDRNEDLRAGTYFGNYFKISEMIWQSIHNPLTLKELIAPLEYLRKDIYFDRTSDKHKNVRKYNNFVKERLIKNYFNTQTVLDLASGKGQDLWKYVNASIKNVLMVEYDINAIDKIIDLKYKIFNSSDISSLNLNVMQFDLTKPYKKLIESVSDDKLDDKYANGTIPLIVCNLALHYLVDTKKNMENIANLVNYYIKKNGEFLFTILNKNKIDTLLKNNNSKWEISKDNDILYSIEYADKSHKKIALYLPCSHNKMEETLIDLYELDKVFKKHNIIRTETESFSKYMNLFQKKKYNIYNELSTEDKTFIDLYQYVIYKKM